MTVNELMDMLSRLWVHKQISGDMEVRFSTPNKNFAINGIMTSQENKTVYLSCVYTENLKNLK